MLHLQFWLFRDVLQGDFFDLLNLFFGQLTVSLSGEISAETLQNMVRALSDSSNILEFGGGFFWGSRDVWGRQRLMEKIKRPSERDSLSERLVSETERKAYLLRRSGSFGSIWLNSEAHGRGEKKFKLLFGSFLLSKLFYPQ